MCNTPIVITDKRTNEKLSVPCGRCPKCTSRRISGWSFRLMQEDKISSSALFVTMTYADNQAKRTRNNYLTLDKKHVQDFFKRLRKNSKTDGIKYYAVGEYGGKTARPHYHAIIFNARPEQVIKAWTKGSVFIGDVNGASVGYTLKYISKPGRIPYHRNDDRLREFALMSKGWGLITSPHKWLIGIKTI